MIGYRAAVNRMRIDDFHATVLDILGMDHKRAGLPLFRPQFPSY